MPTSAPAHRHVENVETDPELPSCKRRKCDAKGAPCSVTSKDLTTLPKEPVVYEEKVKATFLAVLQRDFGDVRSMIEEFARLMKVDLLHGLSEGIIMVTGAPGTGKSSLCKDIACAVGGPRLCHPDPMVWKHIRPATSGVFDGQLFTVSHLTNDTFMGAKRTFFSEKMVNKVLEPIRNKSPEYTRGLILLEGHRLQEVPALRDFVTTSVHMRARSETSIARGRLPKSLQLFYQSWQHQNPLHASLCLSSDCPDGDKTDQATKLWKHNAFRVLVFELVKDKASSTFLEFLSTTSQSEDMTQF